MEIWKDVYFVENGIIYDYRGLYQVSNYGMVKSLNYRHTGKEKILKAGKDGNYECVVLCNDGNIKRFRVHRLVAFMFLSDSYFDGAEVDHIDTNPSNNHVNNLRWRTHKENCNNELSKKHYSGAKKGENHPMYGRTGEKHPFYGKGCLISGEKNGRAILVDRFTLNGQYLDTKYQFEYVRMGFTSSCISACCRGKQKTHKGFIFKYHEE